MVSGKIFRTEQSGEMVLICCQHVREVRYKYAETIYLEYSNGHSRTLKYQDRHVALDVVKQLMEACVHIGG